MSIPPLEPEIRLPPDEGLPELGQLFDNRWVWNSHGTHLGEPEETPDRIRTVRLSDRPGSRAIASYAAEWEVGSWVVEDQFAIEMVPEKPERVFRYPDDPYLPGLRLAASAVDAPQLLSKYVDFSPHRLRVDAVRYRPSSRAVLRHIATWQQRRLGRATFFVRVMRPRRTQRLLAAADLVQHCGFVLPRIVGTWEEGGVVWMTRIRGETVRNLIRKGEAPEPQRILDGLEKLWSVPMGSGRGQILALPAGYQMTSRLLSQLLQGEEAGRVFERVSGVLGQFAHAWQPSTMAHNDFYDDQMLVTPEGEIALVDFEEAGPGDPLFDVGNILAHLRWMAWFGNATEACDAYRHRMRSAALERFGWQPEDLAVREAFALFRLSSWPVDEVRPDWAQEVEAGLGLVIRALEGPS